MTAKNDPQFQAALNAAEEITACVGVSPTAQIEIARDLIAKGDIVKRADGTYVPSWTLPSP